LKANSIQKFYIYKTILNLILLIKIISPNEVHGITAASIRQLNVKCQFREKLSSTISGEQQSKATNSFNRKINKPHSFYSSQFNIET
jgi:hypothetical protein